jgi:hypothetical protein
MTSAQEQYSEQSYPWGVPKEEFVGHVRKRVLRPWQNFPRNYVHLLAGERSQSLARKRRHGDRPLTVKVLIGWLLQCKRVDHREAGRASLQPLAELIDCDVVPRAEVHCQTLAEEIADVSRSAGEALAIFAESMVDAEIDVDEAAMLLDSLCRLHDEVDEAVAALRRRV